MMLEQCTFDWIGDGYCDDDVSYETFWASRQDLEAIKIATESWDITLQDYKHFIPIT